MILITLFSSTLLVPAPLPPPSLPLLDSKSNPACRFNIKKQIARDQKGNKRTLIEIRARCDAHQDIGSDILCFVYQTDLIKHFLSVFFLGVSFRFSPLPPGFFLVFSCVLFPAIPLFPCIYVFPFQIIIVCIFLCFLFSFIPPFNIYVSFPLPYLQKFHVSFIPFKNIFPFHLSIAFSASFHLRYLHSIYTYFPPLNYSFTLITFHFIPLLYVQKYFTLPQLNLIFIIQNYFI